MLIEALTQLTSALLGNTSHRDAKGLAKRWIDVLRYSPRYYETLFKHYNQSQQTRLTQIHLEPTSACNLRCTTCYNPSMQLKKGLVTLERAKAVIDEAWTVLGESGILGLFLRGESVLHPNLSDIICYAKNKGFKHILLSTNLMLIDEQTAGSLLQSGLSELRLSIDTVDPDDLETIRQGCAFDRIEQTLNILNTAKTKLGVNCHFRLHASMHRRAMEHIPQMLRKWGPLVQQFRFTVAVNQGGLFSQAQAQEFSGLKFATSTKFQIPCRILFNYIGVMWDGQLSSCCVDYRERFVAGTLNEGIQAVFENDFSNALRSKHLAGDFGELCGKCGFNNVLVDWFEDELNDYVNRNMNRLLEPSHDDSFKKVLNRIVLKFDRLSEYSVKRPSSFIKQ